MGDQIDLGRERLVNLLQHLASALHHDHQPGRERDQLLHHAPLLDSWLTQNGMQRGDNRHSQFTQQRQDVPTCGPAENAEFVLQADDVHIADVEEVRGPQIGGQVLLLNLEANYFRVLVAAFNIGDRHCETLALGMRSRHGGKQIRRERGNAALTGQIITQECNLADFRMFFHRSFVACCRVTLLCVRQQPCRSPRPAMRREIDGLIRCSIIKCWLGLDRGSGRVGHQRPFLGRESTQVSGESEEWAGLES